MQFIGPNTPGRRIVDQAPVPTWVSDAHGGGIFFNKAWLAYTGHTIEDELGGGWLNAVFAGDRAPLEDALANVSSHGPFWTEFRLRRHDGVYRWLLSSAAPRFTPEGEFLGYIGSCIDVTDRKVAQDNLTMSEQRLRFAIQNSPVMLYHCGRDLRYTWVTNPHPDWSHDHLLGKRDDEILQPRHAANLIAFKQRVVDTGLGAREEISIAMGERIQTWDITAEPLLDSEGYVSGLTVAALDVTERKAAEDRQRLLTAELDHRVRNTLAAIQSLVTLSARSNQSKEDYTLALQGRIDAYTRIYGLLGTMQWQCVDLHQLVDGIVRTFGSTIAARFQVEGENLYLNPSAGISVNLILHELATNAVRYGAASSANGLVSLSWAVRDDSFVLSWRESDGPAMPPQIRAGFGTRLIRQLLAKDLRATFQLEYPPGGAVMMAAMPLKRLEVERTTGEFLDTRSAGNRAKAPDRAAVDLAQTRILLVEDDPLIGLEFQTALTEAGVEAVGPMPDLHRSLAAIMSEGRRFDAVILDVNLRGESTFPLAQLLSERGIPYMFVSGYDLETALPSELRMAPKLQKPVSGMQLLAAVRNLIAAAPTGRSNGVGGST